MHIENSADESIIATGSAPPIALFDSVLLLTRHVAEGEDMPAGATGAVVEMYPAHGDCIVEFESPHWAVVTVPIALLRRRME